MISNKPIAVLIADVHYNLQTLPLADAAMRQAITKANNLSVPLIIAGDIHDTKANMRAECINTMIETFKLANIKPYVLRGNHDSINEKTNNNALKFLKPYAKVIRTADYMPGGLIKLISYQHNPEKFKAAIKVTPHNTIIIAHQGLTGTNSGEYIQDKSAVVPNDIAGYRVISGHYHTRQIIDLPNGGKWDYLGNPFTLNFAEANDLEKGYQILYNDGSLEFVPTNLRKHVVIEITENGYKMTDMRVLSTDLVYVKAIGSKEWLSKLTKRHVADKFAISSFKLDLIPTDAIKVTTTKNLTLPQQLDETIDKLQVTPDKKQKLKNLWKNL
jgi:DNA repair exonuclease SbcCD nuclease subunit